MQTTESDRRLLRLTERQERILVDTISRVPSSIVVGVCGVHRPKEGGARLYLVHEVHATVDPGLDTFDEGKTHSILASVIKRVHRLGAAVFVAFVPDSRNDHRVNSSSHVHADWLMKIRKASLDAGVDHLQLELFDDRVDIAELFTPVSDQPCRTSIRVIGSQIHIRDDNEAVPIRAFAESTQQIFGSRTMAILSRLTVGVVGCSGTGSPIIEMLTRLGVGRLILVDEDRIEERNLNRIYGTTADDAGRSKVDVLRDHVERIGLGTVVDAIPTMLSDPRAISAIAQCDAVFGCMDSIDGRNLLNRLATFYLVAYLDVGVRLEPNGEGGLDQVCGSVNYLIPGGSSLLSRGLYTAEQLAAVATRAADPDGYAALVREGYLAGVDEPRPAVISINTMVASLAINELLARLHPFRDEDNDQFAKVTITLSQMRLMVDDPEGPPCPALVRFAGRGDAKPMLGMPQLSMEAV